MDHADWAPSQRLTEAVAAFRPESSDASHPSWRTLLEEDNWFASPWALPGARFGAAAEFVDLPTGESFPLAMTLLLYTSPAAAVAAGLKGTSIGIVQGGLSGVDLFSRLQPPLAAVVIDIGSESAAYWRLVPSTVRMAEEWAARIRFERSLRLAIESNDFGAVLDCLESDSPNGDLFGWVLPDDRIVSGRCEPGERGMALFTAPDCAICAKELLDSEPDGARAVFRTVQARIVRDAGLLGFSQVTINPFGPGPQLTVRYAPANR